MDTLMRMQASYDIAQTRKREGKIHVLRIAQLADAQVWMLKGEPGGGRKIIEKKDHRELLLPFYQCFGVVGHCRFEHCIRQL